MKNVGLVHLVFIPVGVHVAINLFFALEAESSSIVLFGCMVASFIVGVVLGVQKVGRSICRLRLASDALRSAL